ncbi:MAG: hypothetical protein ACT4NV_18180 [Rhodoferax sp.]
MAQILFLAPPPLVEPTAPRRCCERCGTELWTITTQGWVACADCELIHPLRVQPLLERATLPETSTLP